MDIGAETVAALAPLPSLEMTFVHGTWGRGFFPRRREKKRWFEPGGPFRKQLESALRDAGFPTVQSAAELWSGSNSIRERDRAARSLAKRLKGQREQAPQALRLVVAHSHGGNVAARAFAYMDGDHRGIILVTLATPFLELFPSASPAHKFLWPALLIVLLAVALSISRYVVLQEKSDLAGIASVIAVYIFIMALDAWGDWQRDHEKSAVQPTAALSRQSAALVERASHQAYRDAAPPTFVVRGVDDEASLTLAAGAIANRLGGRGILVFVGALINVAAFIVLPLFLLMMYHSLISIGVTDIEIYTEPAKNWQEWLLRVIASPGMLFEYAEVIPLSLIWFMSGWVIVWRTASSVYGRELFLRLSAIDISSNSVPDLDGDLSVVTLRDDLPERSSLRHAIYKNRYSVSAISKKVVELARKHARDKDPDRLNDEPLSAA
jgi:hypothetical protein